MSETAATTPQLDTPDAEHVGFQPTAKVQDIKPEDKIPRNIAYVLLFMLGFSMLLQYVSLSVLVWRGHGDSVANFEHLFNAWLPVIAGLSGSAVTFYLTKEKK